MKQCNPALAQLIDSTLQVEWVNQLDALRGLEPFAGNKAFRQQYRQIKQANKQRLAAYIARITGIIVNPTALFDCKLSACMNTNVSISAKVIERGVLQHEYDFLGE